MPGIVAGVTIFGVINHGLTFIEVNPYWQQIVNGRIIVVAVAFDIAKYYAENNGSVCSLVHDTCSVQFSRAGATTCTGPASYRSLLRGPTAINHKYAACHQGAGR